MVVISFSVYSFLLLMKCVVVQYNRLLCRVSIWLETISIDTNIWILGLKMVSFFLHKFHEEMRKLRGIILKRTWRDIWPSSSDVTKSCQVQILLRISSIFDAGDGCLYFLDRCIAFYIVHTFIYTADIWMTAIIPMLTVIVSYTPSKSNVNISI